MTRAELIETGVQLLVIAGSCMEDLAPCMIERVDHFGQLASRAECLRQSSGELRTLADAAQVVARLAEEARE